MRWIYIAAHNPAAAAAVDERIQERLALLEPQALAGQWVPACAGNGECHGFVPNVLILESVRSVFVILSCVELPAKAGNHLSVIAASGKLFQAFAGSTFT